MIRARNEFPVKSASEKLYHYVIFDNVECWNKIGVSSITLSYQVASGVYKGILRKYATI